MQEIDFYIAIIYGISNLMIWQIESNPQTHSFLVY